MRQLNKFRPVTVLRRTGGAPVRAAAVFMAALVFAAGAPASGATPAMLPSFDTVRAAHRSSDIAVLDRRGETLALVRVDFAERRGAWISLNSISPALQRAVQHSEDHRFYEHEGVDWLAIAAAGWGWVSGQGTRGASTLSMQLAALLDESLQRPAGGRSLAQKIEQARQAWRLEDAWSKEQIFEAYLNLAAFRGELRGVEAVSRVMFGKHPHGLNPREAAVAAALLRGPNATPSLVAERACVLLKDMRQGDACTGLVDDAGRWLGATARAAADTPSLAPHFARSVVAHHGDAGAGAALTTTLDSDLQKVVLGSVARQLSGMGHAQLTDAAVVVLSNDTGEVLAYVGSSGTTSAARDVDHARARRQAGSTLKPLLYAQALELRYLTAASLLDDSPLDVATSGGMYVPENYDRRHSGLVSVRTALASSLNIPAVRVLMLVGPERFAERLRRVGLPLVHDGDHYGYSLSLGSADVDLLSLTNAYRVMANGGRWGTPIMMADAITDTAHEPESLIFDPIASWIVGDILSDRQARARGFGLENALVTRFWSAVKTGTSKDMRDNWTLGWSDQYTVGVWVGNSAGLSMRDVSGVSGAAPIWHEVMSALHAQRVSARVEPPAAAQQRRVTFANDLEAPRNEYFLPGTVVTHVAPANIGGVAGARIVSPAHDTVIALDPDMPADNQRLVLRASGSAGPAEPVLWRLGSRVIAEGHHAYWRPFPGRHRITLEDAQGAILDEIGVQVRGLPLVRRR